MRKFLFIFFSFILLSSWMVVMPPDQSEEASAHIKAIYIYNFTKYIEWPENYKEGNFVIGLVGSNVSLLSELNKMAATKTVGTQKIEVQQVSSVSETSKYNIVYILSDNSSQLPDVSNKLKGKSTLIVTDKTGMTKQGSAINFVIVDNKQQIELNKTNIEKYKLKVATKLVEMAVPVK